MNKCAVLVMGTFNPITNAHIGMGLKARKVIPNVDIFYIPDNYGFMSSWKKIEQNIVFNNLTRHKMLNIILPRYGFNVSYIEDDETVSGKTYDTVNYFKSIGYSDVYICMGTDKLCELEKWYEIDKLLSENHILLFDRDDETLQSLNIPFLEPFKERFIEVGKLDCNEISSTQVRKAYNAGRLDTVQTFIPKEVYEHLKKRG